MIPGAVALSCFVNLLQTEETREQIVLIVDGPIAGEAEALPEPQHRFESGNGSTCRLEGLEAADLGHVFRRPKMVALMPCCKCLVTSWTGLGCKSISLTTVLIVDGNVFAPSVPIFPGDSGGSSLSIFRKNRFAASRSRFVASGKPIGFPCLSIARSR